MPLRVGTVGIGRFGWEHARLLSRMDNVNLECVVDITPQRAQDAASKFHTKSYYDFRDILDKVDAVTLAVPTISHLEIAKAFLERRIPTLVEKPLCKTVEQARDLVEIAKKNNTLLAVGHVERFNPVLMTVHQMIKTPRFIESQRLSPFRFRSADIDVVSDLMIHDIDIILDLVDSDLKTIDAVGVALLFGNEDIANARLEFENGTVANLSVSRISDKTVRKLRIFTEHSYASIDFLEKKALIYTLSDELSKALADTHDKRLPTDADLKRIPKDFYKIKQIKINEEKEALKAELESFVKSVQTKTRPVVSGEDGLKAMQVVEAVLKEIKEHTWK